MLFDAQPFRTPRILPERRSFTYRSILALILGVSAAASVACDEFPNLTYVNETDSRITVSGVSVLTEAGTFGPLVLEPGESRRLGTGPAIWPKTITAFDEDGTLVFSRRFSFEELKGCGFSGGVVPTDGTGGRLPRPEEPPPPLYDPADHGSVASTAQNMR